MKTAIITAYNGRYSCVGDLTSQVNLAYAQRWGIDFIASKQEELAEGRPPAWGKIRLLQKVLSNYGWVLWIDADAMVVDFTQDLRRFIDDDYDIVLAAEELPEGRTINTGVAWYRNSSTTNMILKSTWEREDCIHHSWWEQGAMIEVLKENLKWENKVKKLDIHPINVKPNELTEGDIVVHTAGGSANPEHKAQIMKQLIPHIKA